MTTSVPSESLSPVQLDLLLLSLLEGRPGDSCQQMEFTLPGILAEAAFSEAWTRLAAVEPALRVTFRTLNEDAVPEVEVASAVEPVVGVINLTESAPEVLEAALARARADERVAGVGGPTAPLWRVVAFGGSAAGTTVLLTLHAALLDERSRLRLIERFASEYAAAKEGRSSPTRPAAAYGSRLELADAISAESFWRRKLEGTAPTRVWSSGADGTAAAALDVIHTSLDTELVSAIDHLAESAGGSSEAVIEAAWALVLSRASGLDEVCFGVRRPDSGVRLNGDADTLGVLDRMTTTVVEVERDLTARAWLGRLRVGRDEAWLYSAVPVARVAQWSGSLRKGAPFEIVLELDLDATEGARRQRAVEMLGLRLERTRESNGVPLALVVRRARGMSCRLDFDAARVSPTLAQGLLAGLARALAAITSCPDAPLADIRIADPLAPTVASPAAPWIGGMAAVLDDRIHESLHATAIIAGEESLTYGELKARAALVAGALRAEGIRAGDTVGLYLERGTEVAVGVLGILRAGAAWLPLDPAYPRGRVCDVLRDAGAAVLLTQRAHAGELEAAGVRELLLEDCAAAAPSEIVPVAADAPAYVIYTSGSTGKPKGVTITHGNLVHYASAIASASGLGASDRYVHTASMAFSSSVRQLMAPLAVGATVVMARRAEVADPRELLRLARERQATVLDLVPSYWARVVEALESEPMLAPATLRLALSASEPLPSNTVMRLQAQLPADIRLMNMYGQTETTGIVSTFEVGRGRAADTTGAAVVPIGRPIPGARVEVLDHLGHPLPAGISGELHVGGATVGLGYRGNAALTGERFHVGRDASLGRLFATGDLGVRDADGVLRFVGRRDTQVKIRGHRVEVEEVEAILTRHAGVSAAAVEARTSGGGAARLVAFVVSTDLPVPPRELRDHLALSVPDYMIPAAFQSLDALPRTANGKLDRAALSRLSVQFGALETAYQAPRDGAEAALTAIFTEVLGVPRVGIADHFFEMGGHSLMAIRVLARIRARFEVDLPLKTLFERPTVVALAERIRETHVPAGAQRPLAPLPAGAVAPLSFAQERLWVLNQIEPDSAAYNLVATFRLRGKLTALALEAALTEIERRHEALRTVFENVDGVARATVRAPHAFALPVEEVAAAGDRDEALRRRAAALAAVPFDLAAGPLFRGTLLRADNGDHLLVLVMHHIVSDGWSRGVLYRELGALYEAFAAGKASPLPELPIQYGDFAAWQRDRLDEPALASQLQYWTHQLAAPLPTLDLPTDRPRPPLQTFKGATRTFRIAPELAERMRALGATEDATPFMALLAGFHMLLGRYSGQQDIVVGSPTAGRTRLETESLIGFFVNTLALRGDLSGNPSFRTMLQRTRTMALDAFQYQDLPFERLVEGLHLPRDLSRSPLFQVLFILQNTPVHPLALTGITLEQVDVDAGAAKFDLTLALVAGAGGYTGHLEYNTDLFDDATIERLAGHYVHLLESAMAAPDRPIGRLGLLPASERRELLETWNDTATEYERDATIASLFEAQVRRTPAAPAASFEAETLSYAELNARANRLARHLRAEGVGPDVFVGIHLERSLEMLVAMLATLKAGGAYLPLDPAYPADRIAFMLEDSGAPVVLTQARLAHRLPALAAKIVRVDADEAQFAAFGPKDLGAGARPEDLAYVIYTSGSTGRPKGVMIEHRNVTNFFAGMDDRIGGKAPGTWLAVTSISFDISVLELFWTLTRGFHVVIQGDPERVRMQQGTPRSDRKLGLSLFYFANDAGETPDNKYQMLLESAKFADTNGFEAVWVPERHFHAFGGLYPSPAVVGAAIAAITKNVRIRTGSVVLPLHSPVRVAEDWAVVDNLSNGRVALGFASGWHDRDFVFAPQNYADRRKVMLESMDIVARLWRGETIRLPGGSGKEVEISTLPRPIQPELPMWVTAAGTPETFEMAGRIGANVLTHLLGQSPETLREKIAVYRSARKHAKHPGPGHVSLMMHTYLHEDMEEVKRVVWHPFREYLRTAVDLIKGLAEGRGQDMRSAEFTKEDMEALLDHAFHRYFDTSALMGTPESTFDTIERLKGMDVDEVCCLIDFGIPTPAVMRSLDHLAELRRQSDESSASAAADYDVPAQLERWNVTHFQCTPSMAGMLVAQPEVRPAIAGLQCLMVGGEAFPPTLADDLSKLVAGRVVNMYGPTETTIWSATHTLDGAQASVPLGTPIANTSCYVVDRDMEPVPVGVAGELLIGGDGVVRGYLKRPELSAERFIADPFTGRGRLYRTGDLVKWRADGKLDFLGRLDHQVKIRGHRIELGEIEAVLEQQPSVREVVVMAREDVPGDKRIVAYVVARAGGATPDATTLRQAVGERLPEYMVPAHIVVLERLPRTPNLKIDRKALPAPDQLATPGTAYLKPGSELEKRIAEIWQEVLRVPKVGVTDNFFDIGGHSLLTVKVHSRLRGATPRPVSITDLFRFPTIRALAEHLGGAGDVAAAVVAEQAQARAGARREAQQRRRPRRPGTANE